MAKKQKDERETLLHVKAGVLTVKADSPGMHIDVVIKKDFLKQNKGRIADIIAQLMHLLGPTPTDPRSVLDLMKDAEGVRRVPKKRAQSK